MTSNLKPKADRRKKTVTETGAIANSATAAPAISRADIARKAYELYCARGGQNGSEVDDWLRAERELLSLVPQSRRSSTRKGASLD